jgi:hypothetical protein
LEDEVCVNEDELVSVKANVQRLFPAQGMLDAAHCQKQRKAVFGICFD